MPRMAPQFGQKEQQSSQQGDPFQMGGSAPFNPGGSGPIKEGGFGGGIKQPQQFGLDAVPSFQQRRSNAQSMYGPGGAGWASFGGGAPSGNQMMPGPAQAQPQSQQPFKEGMPVGAMGTTGPVAGGMPPTRPMEPMKPMSPPVFQAPPMNQAQFARPQQGADVAPGGMPGGLQALFSQPGFMRMLMQYMQQGQRPPMRQQGPVDQAGPVAGGLGPPQQGY